MDAKEFDKKLTERLNSLTDSEICAIREKFNSEGDYGVDEYGRSYWIPPKATVNLNLKNDYKSPSIDLISGSTNVQSREMFITDNNHTKVTPVVNKEQKLNLKVNPTAA